MCGKFTDTKFYIPSRCPKSIIQLERTLEGEPEDLGFSGGARSDSQRLRGLTPALEITGCSPRPLEKIQPKSTLHLWSTH